MITQLYKPQIRAFLTYYGIFPQYSQSQSHTSKYNLRSRRHVKALSKIMPFSDRRTYKGRLIHTPLDRARKTDLEHAWDGSWRSQDRRRNYEERVNQDVTNVKLYPEWMVSRSPSRNSSGLGRWR